MFRLSESSPKVGNQISGIEQLSIALRGHTTAFGLQYSGSVFLSNVACIMPEHLGILSVAEARAVVDLAKGRR